MMTITQEMAPSTGLTLPKALTCQRILVPVDFTPASVSALKQAAWLAQREGSSLCLLHVVDWVSRSEDPNLFYTPEETGRQAESRLAKLARLFIPPEVPQRILVHRGSPVRQILRTAALLQSDLIILALHRRPFWHRWLARGVAEQIAGRASCHVLLLHTPEAGELDPVCWDDLVDVE